MKKLLIFALSTFTFLSLLAQDELDEIQLKTMTGDLISIHDITTDGHYTILDFWRAGCKPCIVQLNSFNEQLQILADKNISILTINDIDKDAIISRLTERFDWKFDIYKDDQSALYKHFNSDRMGFPMTVILDEQLEVVYQSTGAKVWVFDDKGELYFNKEVADKISEHMDKGEWSKLGTPISDYFNIIAESRQ